MRLKSGRVSPVTKTLKKKILNLLREYIYNANSENDKHFKYTRSVYNLQRIRFPGLHMGSSTCKTKPRSSSNPCFFLSPGTYTIKNV